MRSMRNFVGHDKTLCVCLGRVGEPVRYEGTFVDTQAIWTISTTKLDIEFATIKCLLHGIDHGAADICAPSGHSLPMPCSAAGRAKTMH